MAPTHDGDTQQLQGSNVELMTSADPGLSKIEARQLAGHELNQADKNENQGSPGGDELDFYRHQQNTLDIANQDQ